MSANGLVKVPDFLKATCLRNQNALIENLAQKMRKKLHKKHVRLKTFLYCGKYTTFVPGFPGWRSVAQNMRRFSNILRNHVIAKTPCENYIILV